MSKIISNNANLLFDAQATLGEGPVWDTNRQLLFWVDIEGNTLHAHNPLTNENNHWDLGEMIGAAVPTESANVLLALESGMATLNLDTEALLKHHVLENSDSKMRFNDGKVSPKGNFWIGSMHKEFLPNSGNLYRLSSSLKSSVLIPKTTISNGMAWSLDQSHYYFIDSPTFKVRQFDYDAENDSISNEKIAIKIPPDYGSPDGMCIDSEGMLWIAHWGGHCVRRWNPETGALLLKVNVPALQVSSCCFGGKDLKTLYITTARSGMSKEQLEEFPLSGGLFTFETAVAGTTITYFKDS